MLGKQLRAEISGNELRKILDRDNYITFLEDYSYNSMKILAIFLDQSFHRNLISDYDKERFIHNTSEKERISAIKELTDARLIKSNIYELEMSK